jgi:HEAT repeat protein
MAAKGPGRKWISANELMRELERDPDYQARMAEKERRRLGRVERNLQDAQPLVAQLARQGFDVRTPADLFNKRMNYRSAIPTLIEWLPRISNPDVKAEVASALSVKWAKPAAIPVLLDEFELSESELVRWAIANALEVVADDSAFTRIARWVADPLYGTARQMLVLVLGHMSDPAAYDILVGLLKDEALAGHAVVALGNLRDPRALPAIEPFLTAEKSWIRAEARRATKKLNTAKQ